MSIEPLINKAKQIAALAYAPYSKFRVGACIRSTQGKLYYGCNVENASYGLTSCAEASAISHMISHGDTEIAEIAIIGLDTNQFISPCGACRQRIREFASPKAAIHMANSIGQYESKTLDELLPKSFGPNFLENNDE